MPPVGFEPTISVGERPQTYALDRAATGPGIYFIYTSQIVEKSDIVLLGKLHSKAIIHLCFYIEELLLVAVTA